MAMTRDDAFAALTASGAPFELTTVEVRGHPQRVFATAPPTMRDVLATTAAHGGRDFLVYRDERISFAEHLGLVNGFAAWLAEQGVGHGDRVAIGMRNYPEWVLSFWATLSLGAIAVPLNAWWLGHELVYAIADSGAKALIVDDERWRRLAPHQDELTSVTVTVVSRWREAGDLGAVAWEDLRAQLDTAAPPAATPLQPDDAATILYTSGTTGAPKGALATHRNHVTNIMNTAFVGALNAARSGTEPDPDAATPASLQVFPFFHIGGLSGLYVATAFGMKLVTMYKWDLDEAIDILAHERITATSMVPMLLRELLDSPRLAELDRATLGGISSGGAAVPPDLIRRIETEFESKVAPANGYGLTETTSAIVINSGEDYFRHPDSIGRPAPGADVKIVDSDGDEVPDGTIGELWMRGPNIVSGYWNKPDGTAASFTDGWFHSGDLGYRDEDGFLYVVDRVKDVVIRGGENVYCAEVEAVLFEHPAVHDVAIIGVPHPVYGEEVAAVVNVRPGHDVTASELQEFAATRLARFKVPSRVVFRDELLPRTATGKVLKRDLRADIAPG